MEENDGVLVRLRWLDEVHWCITSILFRLCVLGYHLKISGELTQYHKCKINDGSRQPTWMRQHYSDCAIESPKMAPSYYIKSSAVLCFAKASSQYRIAVPPKLQQALPHSEPRPAYGLYVWAFGGLEASALKPRSE